MEDIGSYLLFADWEASFFGYIGRRWLVVRIDAWPRRLRDGQT